MTADPPETILLVRLSSLGDVVLATAAARALKAARPAARITFLTRADYAPLLADEPWADAVWALPRDLRPGPGLLAWRARMRAARFTAVVDLQTNLKSHVLLLGHPRRLAWRAARLQRRRWVDLRWTRPAPLRPAWLRYVDALTPLGVAAAQASPPRLASGARARARAAAWDAAWRAALGARGERAPLFLAPGARWASKRWPEESFLDVAQETVRSGGRVLVGGDAADRAALPALAAWADAEPAARWFEGELSVLGALLEGAAGAVANDTGLGHLAAAAGVRVVTVFGSTHPALGFAPAGPGHVVLARGLACQPCTLHGRPACPLSHHRCVREITPAQVLRALARGAGGDPATGAGAADG